MNYYLGVDGGGTKTSFECYNQNGRLVARYKLPTCHLLQVTEEEAIHVIKQGVEEIKLLLPRFDSEDCLFIGLGLAGYGANNELKQRIEYVCQRALREEHYQIWNDAQVALAGGLAGEDGVLLIAGTGSIALAKQGNHYQRSGGWGYLFGDEGSAYWVAKQLLAAFSKQADGRAEKTALFSYMMDYFKLETPGDLIGLIAQQYHERTDMASLAVVGSNLADAGDAAAQEILKQAAQELADLVRCHQALYGEARPVITIGGVLEHNQWVRAELAKRIEPSFYLKKACHSPAQGASLLAREYFKS